MKSYLYAAKVCPVCSATIEKVKDDSGYGPTFVCPNKVKLPNGKEFNHYVFETELYCIKIYCLPYKLMIERKETKIYHLRKKPSATSPIQFKRMLIVPTEKIPLDNGLALITKLKIWNLFS